MFEESISEENIEQNTLEKGEIFSINFMKIQIIIYYYYYIFYHIHYQQSLILG